MLVIQGTGPQEPATSGYPQLYDHPYFGQIFLAGALSLIGYPQILNPVSDERSIILLHMIPRLFMGIIAILDTFLVFKIARTRYNLTVAFIASVLFAVMPMTWILRRVYLDTLLMPFMLSSILFAMCLKKSSGDLLQSTEGTKMEASEAVLALISGICLGLAIYTKIPAFTMMTLVGSLVFFNSKKKLMNLTIWLIPVILIPTLWPLYSAAAGQTDLWLHGIIWQTSRYKPLSLSLTNFLQIDPLITVAGIAGFIWTGLRKDFFALVWVVPFLIFSYFIGWVQYFHLIVIFPAFCIATAVLIYRVQRLLVRHNLMLISKAPLIIIVTFGLIVSTILISSDLNANYFKIYAAIAKNIPNTQNSNEKDKAVMVIGDHWWIWDSYWITEYVLGKHHEILDPYYDRNFKKPIATSNVIFIDDEKFLRSMTEKARGINVLRIRQLHDESPVTDTLFNNVSRKHNGVYPNNIYSIMTVNERYPSGLVVIRKHFD